MTPSRLLTAAEVASMLRAPKSWVYERGERGRPAGLLSNWPDRFTLLNRESVIGAADEPTRRAALDRALQPIEAARAALRSSPGGAWTRSTKTFGNEIDALAVDEGGRVLVIEAKDASDTGGVGWTPAQVAVYVRHVADWVAQDRGKAREILQGMLEQRARLGLAGENHPSVAPSVELVPVILIGGLLGRSAKTANSRFGDVLEALRRAGEPLDRLELWQQEGHGSAPVGVSGSCLD